jgi:CDGSH-type Zn-finger protein
MFCEASSKRVKRGVLPDGRIRCLSLPGCVKRMHARVGVRVVLEQDERELDLDEAAKAEAEAQAREVKHARYRAGICIDCGTRGHSPGRPRCDGCHEKFIEWRALGRPT